MKVFHVVQEGRSESTKKTLSVDAKISWRLLLMKIAVELELDEIEGLYDSNGLPYCRLKSIPPNALVTVRMTEECCLLRSLVMDVSADEQYEVSTYWSSVQDSRSARTNLETISKSASEILVKSKEETRPVEMSSRSPTMESIQLMNNIRPQGVVQVLQTMITFASDWDIQTIGLRWLCESTKDDDTAIYNLIAASLTDHLVSIRKIFVHDIEINYYSNWIIGNIISIVSHQNADVELQLIQSVAESMSIPSASPIAVRGMIAIGRLLDTVGSRAAAESHELLLQALFAAMDQYPDDLQVYSNSISLLLIILRGQLLSTDSTAKVLKYAEMTRARFNCNEKLQRAAEFLLESTKKEGTELNPRIEFEHHRAGRAKGALY